MAAQQEPEIMQRQRQKAQRSAPRPTQPEPEPEQPSLDFQKEAKKVQRSAAPPAQRSAGSPQPPVPQTPPQYITPDPVPEIAWNAIVAPNRDAAPMTMPARQDKVGIGLQLENTEDGRGQDVEIYSIVPGFAAADSQLFDVGDLVRQIDGRKVTGMSLPDIKNLTIGEPGTKITLIMRSLIEVSYSLLPALALALQHFRHSLAPPLAHGVLASVSLYCLFLTLCLFDLHPFCTHAGERLQS